MSVTQAERVLRMLRAAGDRGCTTGEFLAARLPRFSARLMELRAAGHRISSEHVRQGEWRYILDQTPLVPPHAPEGAVEAPGALFRVSPTPHWKVDAA